MKTQLLISAILLLESVSFAKTGFLTDDSSNPLPSSSQSFAKDGLPRLQSVLPVIRFDDNPVNHNMHITSDETNYYTINGGSSASGQISQFDLFGNLIQTYPIAIDGRGLSYNHADGYLYASTYLGDVVRIDNLASGTFTIIFPAIMQNSQASFAISTDGTKLYDFYQGTLYIRDFTTGIPVDTITGLGFGAGNYGGEAAVAVDLLHIYTWDATLKTVYIYDQSGMFIQNLPLDSGDNGQSISIANNLLFVSKDGNYSIGTWYGYTVSNIGLGIQLLPAAIDLKLYPNPTSGKVTLIGNAGSRYEIYNSLGEKIQTGILPEEVKSSIELNLPVKGIYFARVMDGTLIRTEKIIVQ